MEKAFQPVFNAEDLHKIPNHEAVTTVLMFGLPTSPFTLKLLPPLGESSEELMHRMREYALSRFGRPRAEVEAEIEERLAAKEEPKPKPAPEPKKPDPAVIAAAAGKPVPPKPQEPPKPAPKKNFLDSWLEKKAALENQAKAEAQKIIQQKQAAPAKKPLAKAPVTPVAPAVATTPAKPATAAPATTTTPAPAVKPMRPEMVALNPVQAQQTPTVSAAEEMIAHTTGSVWAAKAAQNAVAAQQADPTTFTIKHDLRQRRVLMDGGPKALEQTQHLAPTSHGKSLAPVSQNIQPQQSIRIPHAAPVQQVATPVQQVSTPVQAAPVQPQTTAQDGLRATQTEEDGVVLRWR